MAKGKAKQVAGVPHRPIYSRISYLYQAASYLSSTSNHQSQTPSAARQAHIKEDELAYEQAPSSECNATQAISRRLLTDLRATSLKTQIRLSSAMKSTVCKFCDTLLVIGMTCTSVIENKSKGGKKPWADVMVISCKACGGVKRFPVNALRQKRRPLRDAVAHKDGEEPAV